MIIPAYRENEALVSLLKSLENENGIEVIVSVDEGDEISIDSTTGFNVTLVKGLKGRGNQLSAGTEIAKGNVFLFCHADTILPTGWKELVEKTLAEDGVAGGAFKLRFSSSQLRYKLLSYFANLRVSFFNLIYGDQAIFSKRDTYFSIGGFKPLPLMEDVDFIRRLRKAGEIKVIKSPVITSNRRYEKSGLIFGVVRNFILISLYFIGVSPGKLARWYR